MSEFETEATVGLVVRERDLRRVREQIEEAVGDAAVQPGAGAGGRPPEMATDGGASGRQRRRARRSYRMEIQRTDDLEELLEVAYAIEDKVGGDGGMLSELFGGGILGGLLGGAGGAAGGIGGGLATGIGAAVGSAVGDAVGEALSEDFAIEEPDWVPIAVEEPGALPVEDPGPFAVEHPDSIPLDHPDDVPLDHPEDIPLDAPEAIPVEDVDPLPVEEIDPISVDAPESIPVDMSVRTATNGQPAAGDSASPSAWQRFRDEKLRRVPGVGILGDIDAETEDWFEPFGDIPGIGMGSPGSGGGSLGGQPSGQGRAAVPTINVTQTFNTELIVDELRGVADAISQLERELDSAYDELESEIDAVQSDVDDLERQLTRR
ncbi:hypothetical protein [Salinilacihabitans rarus]|uniref:hypothetical protein n=1 Tax=Salinilacihabitans rarus TaxID=2961596 RepID=UPI0020C89F34|nr:hypothetical protein [Salinilacihabitans rarus]